MSWEEGGGRCLAMDEVVDLASLLKRYRSSNETCDIPRTKQLRQGGIHSTLAGFGMGSSFYLARIFFCSST